MSHDELELVDWLRTRQGKHPRIPIGIGDDMAVVRCDSDRLLVSSDLLLDGVHFEWGRHAPRPVGRKAVARALSDCAAMCVRPVAITASVALPSSLPSGEVKELFEGMFECAAEHGAAIAGGDMARWDSPLAIDIVVVAEPFPGIEPTVRSGARSGDGIYVSGPLGGSLLGRHMTFAPRIAEARAIGERLGRQLHAMIDISDGLSLDLWRVCQASGVGAALDEELLQSMISEDATQMASADGRSPLDHALGDGEDYELLVFASLESDAIGLPLYRIGQVVETGLSLVRADGSVAILAPRGYVH